MKPPRTNGIPLRRRGHPAAGRVVGAHPRMTSCCIVDPPSEGLAAPVRRAVLAGLPRSFAYVSCNPATLARDLAVLCEGYELVSVTPLDMFPRRTAEIQIEAVALLRRKTRDGAKTKAGRSVSAPPRSLDTLP